MKNRIVPSAAAALFVLLVAPIAAPGAVRAESGRARWWVPRLRAAEAKDDAKAQQDEVPNNAAPPAPKPVAGPATPGPVATGAAPATAPSAAIGAAAVAAFPPDGALLKAIGRLREGAIGREPNARAYLDLISAGRATPAQVNDFGTYVAKRGMPRVALQFQEYAVRLDRTDATLWLNLGTMQQTVGMDGAAESSLRRSIDLDPNGALAHYNLGSIYDHRKQYDDAIDQYRIALVLDPTLGDPTKNPQVVNNEHLLAVRLAIYQDQAGSLGLPLKQMQAGESKPGAKAAPRADKR